MADFAHLIAVPHPRYAVPLGELDPATSGPPADAGLTSYAAVARVGGRCGPRRPLVILGLGGLGRAAVQVAKASMRAPVVSVVRRVEQWGQAAVLGADRAVLVADAVESLDPRSAGAVIDFVGTQETLELAASLVGPRGLLAVVGLGGGKLPVGLHTLAAESEVTSVYNGTSAQLRRVVALAQAGALRIPVRRMRLTQSREAFDAVEGGGLSKRLVLVP